MERNGIYSRTGNRNLFLYLPYGKTGIYSRTVRENGNLFQYHMGKQELFLYNMGNGNLFPYHTGNRHLQRIQNLHRIYAVIREKFTNINSQNGYQHRNLVIFLFMLQLNILVTCWPIDCTHSQVVKQIVNYSMFNSLW